MGLSEQYDSLINRYSFLESYNAGGIYEIVRNSLVQFLSKCHNPAIWCFGKHTRMLMTDFMFEMKQVKYIIDENYADQEESGFHILKKDQIKDHGIDGILISSYQYKDEIKDMIKKDYPDIAYLDLYEELEGRGYLLNHGYYYDSHPYDKYKKINQLRRELKQSKESEKVYRYIIGEYVSMKDFYSAIKCTEELLEICDNTLYRGLKCDLEEIYQLELEVAAGISQNNVIMFCIDGLRRKDLLGDCLPNIKQYLLEHTKLYTRAYAVSTSTFESLIPAYSENSDLRTKYYESNVISQESCRFISEAARQGRSIYFYTDCTKYIESEQIEVKYTSLTAAEKMWSFLLDAQKEENGLFYIHVLYESHYSYPNPDTEEELIVDGNNIMFDYLERNGGKIRTDYEQQHKDALKYLDRILPPILERLKCRMVLYADHGNILIPQSMQLHEIETAKFSWHEDLIQVPLAIKSPEMEVGTSEKLISIMSLNDMICSLLNGRVFVEPQNEFIKIQRSKIYNPDFQFLYKKVYKERELEAFEVFIFKDGCKLVVYEDGMTMLCDHNDEMFQNQDNKEKYIEKIEDSITVTDCVVR